MKSLFKKITFAVFAISIFLVSQNALAISNIVCVQAGQGINCSLKTDQISKPSLNAWLSNQSNSVTVNLLSENKIISSITSYKLDDYSFSIPISYLKSQGISNIPGNVSFNAKIYKSGPGADPNMVYLDSDTSIVNIIDTTTTTNKTTTGTKTNESATTRTPANISSESVVTGTGGTSTLQKNNFYKNL